MTHVRIIGVEPSKIRFENGVEYLLRRQGEEDVLLIDTPSLDPEKLEGMRFREREFYKSVLEISKKTNKTIIPIRDRNPKRQSKLRVDFGPIYVAHKLVEARDNAELIKEVAQYHGQDCMVIMNHTYSSALHLLLEELVVTDSDVAIEAWTKHFEKHDPEEIYALLLLKMYQRGFDDTSEIVKYQWVEQAYRSISQEAGFGNLSGKELKARAFEDLGSLQKYEEAKEKMIPHLARRIPEEMQNAYNSSAFRFLTTESMRRQDEKVEQGYGTLVSLKDHRLNGLKKK